VGNRAGYKNFSLLLDAMVHLSDYELYIVGGEPISKSEAKIIDGRLKGRVRVLNYVADIQLVELYSEAFCLVTCALDEGFGITIAEAICSGCPVICLDRPIFREVAGLSGLFIENNVEDLISNVHWLKDHWVEQKARCYKYRARFSWDATHDKTLAVYEGLKGIG